MTVLVVGASEKQERYSNKAVHKLHAAGHEVYAFAPREGVIGEVKISNNLPTKGIDTVTLYVNPKRQVEYQEYILGLAPRRVIFNPGTENPEFMNELNKQGIEAFEACTLVMLGINQF